MYSIKMLGLYFKVLLWDIFRMELSFWMENNALTRSLWRLSTLGYCTLSTNVPFLLHVPDRDYLNDEALWVKCRDPVNVVPWNLTLFSILLVIGVIQMLLCAIQVVNGLLGTLCGDCQCCGCCGVSGVFVLSSQHAGGHVRLPALGSSCREPEAGWEVQAMVPISSGRQ